MDGLRLLWEDLRGQGVFLVGHPDDCMVHNRAHVIFRVLLSPASGLLPTFSLVFLDCLRQVLCEVVKHGCAVFLTA